MKQYLDLLRDIKANGVDRSDRTGVGRRSVFGRVMRFDLHEGFPLLTTKKMFLRGIIYELLWELKGDTNIKYLADNNVHIWDEWADEHGELGPVYGAQWRKWQASDGRVIDQVSAVIESIKADPSATRHIVSAWNVADIPKMKLPPCHCFFHFFAANGELSCLMYQRSADVFLGVPFNIASYALLTMMMAQVTGLKPKEFIHVFGDVHIYLNHFEQVDLQLTREPLILPQMQINPEVKSIFDFKHKDFGLVGYKSHPAIKAEIAV